MQEYAENFLDWVGSAEPTWAAFLVFATVFCTLSLVIGIGAALLLYITKGWILLSIPLLILYAFYLTIYK